MLLIQHNTLVMQQAEFMEFIASLSIVNQVVNEIELALLSDLLPG